MSGEKKFVEVKCMTSLFKEQNVVIMIITVLDFLGSRLAERLANSLRLAPKAAAKEEQR